MDLTSLWQVVMSGRRLEPPDGPSCLLRVKSVDVVDYIPIGTVGSLVLNIDQRGVRINPQRKIALNVCFGPV
jgi:hypothetical protein